MAELSHCKSFSSKLSLVGGLQIAPYRLGTVQPTRGRTVLHIGGRNREVPYAKNNHLLFAVRPILCSTAVTAVSSTGPRLRTILQQTPEAAAFFSWVTHDELLEVMKRGPLTIFAPTNAAMHTVATDLAAEGVLVTAVYLLCFWSMSVLHLRQEQNLRRCEDMTQRTVPGS